LSPEPGADLELHQDLVVCEREDADGPFRATRDMIMSSRLDLMPKDPSTMTLEDEVDIPEMPVPGEYKFT
jgi:hypothetical protein